MTSPIYIGISSCLLGENVRYDGGHKRNIFLTDILGKYVEWVPVCPEVESGMGIPRDTLRLIQVDDQVRMVTQKGADHTAAMREYTARRVQELADNRLCGYVLKRSSPSCGMERVKVYQPSGMPINTGRGLFAEGLLNAFPNLPVEEEGRLQDPRLRENFISRVFSVYRWRELVDGGLSRAGLIAFHQAYKYLLMAHNQEGLRRLGRLLAAPEKFEHVEALADAYLEAFTEVMKRTPSRRNHTNALHHMAGYVSDQLDEADRHELTDMIHEYREERLPLIVPITMLRHYIRKFEVAYLQDQVYLYPHPAELMLLNQV